MPEQITTQDAQYALDIVKTICRDVGPGTPGSRQERERAAMIRKELESHLGVGNVVSEDFTFAPDAFLSPLSGIFMLLAALLNSCIGRFSGIPPCVTAAPALAFSLISLMLFVFEFLLGFELVDPLFRKKQSINVIGRLRRPGTTSVKQLLILSGHHDSAPENPWLRFLGYGFFFFSATFFTGLAALLVMSILQMTGVVIHHSGLVRAGTLGWVMLAYPMAPAVLFALFPSRGMKHGRTVPGAADNLSACALAVALSRFLVENPSAIPADTEIRFISFGGEEAGLRGSRRYVERHLDELKRLDARLLNFETVVHPEVNILTTDVNGAVENSPEMVESLVAAAKRAGIPYKVKSASLGVGTDAAPFSRAGLKAATLLPLKTPQQMVAFYHQKWDRPDVLTIEPLFNVLKLTLEWVRCGGE